MEDIQNTPSTKHLIYLRKLYFYSYVNPIQFDSEMVRNSINTSCKYCLSPGQWWKCILTWSAVKRYEKKFTYHSTTLFGTGPV